MLLASIILYLLITVWVGYKASQRVKTSGDFMLAGRSLPLVLSSAALFATWFGSETVFGASSEFLKDGLIGVIEDPFGAALCLLLFGFFYARRLYQMNLLTLGDFFEVRYGKKTELIAGAFLVPSYVGYIAAQLVAMGLILNVVTGLAVWQGVLISTVVVTFYTVIGGMWAISITDFIQSIIIVVGLIVLAVVMSDKAGGWDTVMASVPADRFRFFPEGTPWGIMTWLAAWSVLGLGSVPSQDVYQRAMSSGSARTAEYSCYIAAALYLTVALLPLFISLCAQHLYANQLTGDGQLVLPRMVLEHTNLVVQILFFGSLLSAIMSTTSSAILAPAAIFSENLVRPLRSKPFTDREMLLLTRGSILLFSALATGMAMWRSNIYELVGESSILSLVSLFVPLTFGLYWRRANSAGAILSMIFGLATWLIFKNLDTDWPPLVPALAVSLIVMVLSGFLLRTKTT